MAAPFLTLRIREAFANRRVASLNAACSKGDL